MEWVEDDIQKSLCFYKCGLIACHLAKKTSDYKGATLLEKGATILERKQGCQHIPTRMDRRKPIISSQIPCS